MYSVSLNTGKALTFYSAWYMFVSESGGLKRKRLPLPNSGTAAFLQWCEPFFSPQLNVLDLQSSSSITTQR